MSRSATHRLDHRDARVRRDGCGPRGQPGAVEANRRAGDPGEPAAQGRYFEKTGVTSLDWVSYPILRFAEHPDVVPIVVQRLDEPSTGAGEEVMGATAAALANAFFDATGVRLRQYPMTPERVRATIAGRS
jgi:hypothetical protein